MNSKMTGETPEVRSDKKRRNRKRRKIKKIRRRRKRKKRRKRRQRRKRIKGRNRGKRRQEFLRSFYDVGSTPGSIQISVKL